MNLTSLSALAFATLVTSSAYGSETCSTFRATTPTPPRREVAIERHFETKGNFPQSADAVIIGDSMAERWPRSQLHAALGARATLNLGVRSDRTQMILWRIADLPLASISPKTVLLFAGTNNLNDKDRACAVEAGLDKVISSLKQQWPKAHLMVLPVLPRGADDFSFRDADRQAINVHLKRQAASAGYTFLAVNESTLTCQYSRDQCANYRVDELHLTADGYRVLVATIQAASKEN